MFGGADIGSLWLLASGHLSFYKGRPHSVDCKVLLGTGSNLIFELWQGALLILIVVAKFDFNDMIRVKQT